MYRKLLTPIILSVLSVAALHYFLPIGKQSGNPAGAVPESVVPGQAYTVPTARVLEEPVKREIDFLDKKRTQKEEIISVQTAQMSAHFSTYGGVLCQLDFLEHEGINNKPLRTIHHKTFNEREQASFLLAFEEKTPYFYTFISTQEIDDEVSAIFETKVGTWTIQKTYTMPKHGYIIDLKLSFETLTKEPQQLKPRLFFSGPFVPEVSAQLKPSGLFGSIAPVSMQGVVAGINGTMSNVSQDSQLEQAWIMPEMFGTQSKYFSHILLKDPKHFTQRAFYKMVAGNNLYSVLQGRVVSSNENFNLSFYCGPKAISALHNADARLTKLFSFGWLSWICMLLLHFLNWLYSFVGNYGFAIILMAVLLELPFLPLTVRAKKTMDQYARYQPSINRIRQKYKGDMQRMQTELMHFYKEHNLSPAGQMIGCLPLLLQMPIIFSLYRVLGNSIGLYQAPFFGWLTDLSSRDPYYILPVLMGLSMIAQQLINKTGDERSRIAMMFFSLLMIALFAGFPAGVVLYWLTRNVITLGVDYTRKVFGY